MYRNAQREVRGQEEKVAVSDKIWERQGSEEEKNREEEEEEATRKTRVDSDGRAERCGGRVFFVAEAVVKRGEAAVVQRLGGRGL